jgi:hypothetical protein
MANLIRTAKSSRDWCTNEVLAYRMTLLRQDASEFFGRELGSIDHLDPNLLSTTDPGSASTFSKETYRFLVYLHLASRARTGHDFAKCVLEVMGFDELGTVLRTRHDIPFTICGDNQVAETDVCLVHLNSMILLVVQDRPSFNGSSPECQVIADAVAAFQYNNHKLMDIGREPLDKMVIPCITMVGTRPCFYKVPVTKQLSDSIITGQYPHQPTFVTLCSPPPIGHASNSMQIPAYRRTALQYYDAFRELVKASWAEFLAL